MHEHAITLANNIQSWLGKYFPLKSSQPKKEFISLDTWALRKERIGLVKNLRTFKQQIAHFDLWLAWRAWKSNQTLTDVFDEHWHLLYLLYRVDRAAGEQLLRTKSSLRKALRADRTAYLETVAFEAEHGDPNQFFRRLRTIGVTGKKKAGGTRPLPRLRDADGTFINTREKQAERWRTFFALQEDGVDTTPADLLHGLDHYETNDIWWHQMPSLMDYEFALRRVRTGKAFFIDGIPGEILHVGVKQLAQHCYNLFLKQYLSVIEPVLFRGGRLTPMYKGKGDPSCCESSRSIFISSALGKVHHSLIRRQLNEYFDRYAIPCQYGGRRGKSVSMASHSLQIFLADSRQRKQSTAVVFVDIRQAFYRLIRSHALDIPVDDDFAQRVFASLGLDQDAFPDFVRSLDTTAALNSAGVPDHLRRLLVDSFQKTWFFVNGSSTLTETRQGSRPGDVYADMVFSFAISRIMKKVTAKLQKYGLLQEISWDGGHHPLMREPSEKLAFTGPIWADDICIALRNQNPLALVQMTQATAGVLFDELAIHGMDLNRDPGKTEVLLSLRGKGSQELRRRLAFDNHQIATTSTLISGTLRIVGSYRHLGVWVQADGELTREFNTRFAIAHSTITQLKTTTFANRNLSLTAKVRLFDSLIASALFYNSATWGLLSSRQANRFYKGCMKLYKRLAILHFGHHAMEWNDLKVREHLGVLAPDISLRIARLRYLGHLIVAGDDAIWALLQQLPPWWSLIEHDVNWMQAQRRYPLPHGPLLEDWNNWQHYIRTSPSRWKQIVKRAASHAIAQQSLQVEWSQWHRYVADFLIENGQISAAPSPALTGSPHYCISCQQQFSSKANWSVHAFRKHHRLSRARSVAEGTQCGQCLRTYDNHFLLIRHLTYSQSCRDQLLLRGVFVSPTPSINSKEMNQNRKYLKVPYLQGQGPAQPLGNPLEPAVLFGPEQKALWHGLRSLYYGRSTLSEMPIIFEECKLLISQQILHQDEVLEVLRVWQDFLESTSAHEAWDQAAETLRQLLCAELFFDVQSEMVPFGCCDATFEVWLADALWPTRVERPLQYNPIICAHLFSGHRREGDVQSALEQITLPDGLSNMVLSVDIIFSEDFGNLLNPSTFSLFARACHEGIIAILLAGPPCESWSKARLRGEWDGGPRQVRSEVFLSGLPTLTLKELSQVRIGNQLLGVAVRLAFIQWFVGSFFLLEHPACPHEAGAPSIWKVPLLRYLCGLPGNALHTIYSGYYGAPTAKPTSLLLVNGPEQASEILMAGRVCEVLPQGGSIGKDDFQQWRTSKLKEYPQALCSTMGALAVAHLNTRSRAKCKVEVPADFLEGFLHLQISLDFSAQMGPDFHPARN